MFAAVVAAGLAGADPPLLLVMAAVGAIGMLVLYVVAVRVLDVGREAAMETPPTLRETAVVAAVLWAVAVALGAARSGMWFDTGRPRWGWPEIVLLSGVLAVFLALVQHVVPRWRKRHRG